MPHLPMIERKNAWGEVIVRDTVRDDIIREYVACVPCKGSGRDWRMTGGGLWSQEWTGFLCPHCYGQRYWRDPSFSRPERQEGGK